MNKERVKLISLLSVLVLCLVLCSCSGSGGDLFGDGDSFPDIADTVMGPEDVLPDDGQELPADKTPDEDIPNNKEDSTDTSDKKDTENTEDSDKEVEDPTPAPIEAESVTVDKTSVTLYVGDSVALKATVLPSDASDKSLNWSSSDSAIVTVDQDGNVVGIAQGQATVTVKTSNGKTANINVKVEKRPVAVDSITLLPVRIEIYEGETAYAVPYILPDNADDKSVTYLSSDPSVVAVNENGLVTAISQGTATIKATTSNGKTASIPVTVLSTKLVASDLEYYYSTLTSEREKKIYTVLRDAMASCRKDITDPTTVYAADVDAMLVESIFRMVLLDHPEFFHVDREYSRHTVGGVTTQLILSYNMTAKDYEKALDHLDGALEPILETIGKTAGEGDRALVAYNYVKEHFTYDSTDLSSACNLYKAFVSGKAVCEGYSKLFGYILKKSGIESLQITGNISDGGHQWTMAKINGKWYHFDPTWDDPETKLSNAETPLHLNYFALPDDVIYLTRTAHSPELMPEAYNLDENYFVKNSLVLADLSSESLSAVARRSANLSGHIAMLCSLSVYNAILEESSYLWLLVGYVADDASNISYVHDDNLKTIEIFYK